MNVSVPTRCVYFVDGCLVVDSIIGVRACGQTEIENRIPIVSIK